MNKSKTQTKPLKLEKCRLFTDEDIDFEHPQWVDGLGTDIELIKENKPNMTIYEYRLVAVHTPPVVPTEYTRKELQ